MKRQMYLTETRCDKIPEDVIAYQISTIRPVIESQSKGDTKLRKRLYFPMKRYPEALMTTVRPSMGNFVYQPSYIDNMCAALLPQDHCHDLDDLSQKLLKVLTMPNTVKDLRLVAITVLDGRLCFNIWNVVSMGFQEIKVLPTEIRGTESFEFGIQAGRCSRDRIWIRCAWDNSSQFRYIVDRYYRGEIMEMREIVYKVQQNTDTDKRAVPHFSGYMNTLTVQ